MTNEIKSKILKIMELALILNPTETRRDETGDKPTVFFDYSGHAGYIRIAIHSEGWSENEPFATPDKLWDIYLEVDSDEVNTKLDEIIDRLIQLIETWG